MNRLLGDSSEQQNAEEWLLKEFEQDRSVKLIRNHRIELDTGSYVKPDGFCNSPKIICEAYAHVGLLRGGQPNKVMKDAFKLLFINRAKFQDECKLVLLFGDQDAAARFQVTSKTWMAQCLKTWRLEVVVIKFDSENRKKLQQAQERQRQ